jgi:hypothetical protein
MANQNHRAAHGVDCGLCVLLIVGVRSLGRLCHRHFVAVILEDIGNPLPARAIRESSMYQNYILNMLTHDHFSFAVKIHSDQLSFDVERLRAEPLLFQ